MKQSAQPDAVRTGTTCPPARSAPSSAEGASSSGRLNQLAAMINGGRRVGALAQLRSEIHESPRVHNFMGLVSESQTGAPVQLANGDESSKGESGQSAGPALLALLDELEASAEQARELAAQDGEKSPSEEMIARLGKLRAIAEGNDEKAKAEVLAALRSELDHSGAEPASGPPVQLLGAEAIVGLAIVGGVVGVGVLIGLGYLAKKTYEYIRDRREDALLAQYRDDPESVPILGTPPAEITEGIAGLGTNPLKAARLFRNINNFRFRYTGQFNNANLAFQVHQGDCRTLVGMYRRAADHLNIPNGYVHQAGPMLVAAQAIHGRNTLGNTEGDTHWYFTEHFWATGAGTAYDVLFMVSPPPAFALETGTAIHNRVTYHTFANGRCLILPGEAALHYDIQGTGKVFANAVAAQDFIDAH